MRCGKNGAGEPDDLVMAAALAGESLKSQPDPDFTPEQRAAVVKAAGVVVSCDAGSRETLSPGRVTRPADGPRYPQEQDCAPAAIVGARTPEAA